MYLTIHEYMKFKYYSGLLNLMYSKKFNENQFFEKKLEINLDSKLQEAKKDFNKALQIALMYPIKMTSFIQSISIGLAMVK